VLRPFLAASVQWLSTPIYRHIDWADQSEQIVDHVYGDDSDLAQN
jgi:hypothetical protein